jgi:TolB protein
MRNVFRGAAVVVLLAVLPLTAARAVLKIEITKGVVGAIPIAIVPFGERQVTGAPPGTDVAKVVSADLARSGRFKPIGRGDMLAKPTRVANIDFGNWRALSVNDLVIGRILPDGQGYDVEFQVFNVYNGRQLLGYSIPTSAARLRSTAHRISDMIYKKLTGQRGAFNTRIAYVSVKHAPKVTHYRLIVADADGHDPQTIVRSTQPLMSPNWSPDGKRIAYVSFEHHRANIYIQNLYSGKRRRISSRPGLNSAPVFSPNGRKLALVLSSSPGNPDLYIMDIKSKHLRRITTSSAIDTEPAWTPNGKKLIFTSNRGGGPQIYEVNVNGGGAPQRLTFEGSYNARPELSPDGKQLAMVHRERGKFRIAVMNLQTGALQVLTNGRLDESPSFAPNGQMIIYATEHGGRDMLAAVSADGQVQERLASTRGDVQEPAWSPYSHG